MSLFKSKKAKQEEKKQEEEFQQYINKDFVSLEAMKSAEENFRKASNSDKQKFEDIIICGYLQHKNESFKVPDVRNLSYQEVLDAMAKHSEKIEEVTFLEKNMPQSAISKANDIWTKHEKYIKKHKQ